MYRPRIIPVLLLKGKGLVKTTKFKDPRYIGDPINAVKIFNDLRADELIFLDIYASLERRTISVELVKEIGDEAFMPFAVGGGIININQVEEIIKSGAEKVILNKAAAENPNLIKEIVKQFGSQSLVISVDVKKDLWGNYKIKLLNGTTNISTKLIDYLKKMEELGAGEIMLNSIDHDGMMNGYDLNLIKFVSDKINIPLIACGGAGELENVGKVTLEAGASAAAAGSLFVYHGNRKAVLINYPSQKDLLTIFGDTDDKISAM